MLGGGDIYCLPLSSLESEVASESFPIEEEISAEAVERLSCREQTSSLELRFLAEDLTDRAAIVFSSLSRWFFS